MKRNYTTTIPLQFLIVIGWVVIVGSIAVFTTVVLIVGGLNYKLKGKGVRT